MLTTTKIRRTTSITLAHDMGGATSFKPIFNVTFPFFFVITITTTLTLIGPLIVAETDDDSRETPPIPSLEDNNGATIAAVATPPPPSDGSTRNSGHFKRRSDPSTVVVVGALTTMFSFTFLLLLYIKNCNGGNVQGNGNNQEVASLDARMNSGINRAIVELLPIFRFRSLSGKKEGLDCAICLMRFEDPEVLRLLPKCKHAFHVECVDKWLHAHSTCPLCRYKVESKDIATRQREKETEEEEEEQEEEEEERFDIESGTRRVSGRHSSVMGEKDRVFFEIVMQDSDENKTTSSSRSKSLDDASRTSGGNFVCPRRDDKLLKQQNNNNNSNNDNTRISQHKLEHRIIIDCPSSSSSTNYNSDVGSHQNLWSEARPSNLLYLTSEMITRHASILQRHRHSMQEPPRQWSARRARRMVHGHAVSDGSENIGSNGGGSVYLRSVSEITGLRRFLSGGSGRSRNGGRERQHGGREEQDRRQYEGVVTRWLAWILRSQKPRGDVR